MGLRIGEVARVDRSSVAARPPHYWTPEVVVQAIRDRAASGRSLRSDDVHALDGGLYQAARGWYGSWAEGVTAAGLDYSEICRVRRWSSARVKAEIRERADGGQTLLVSGVAREGRKDLVEAARRYFGSWNEAISAAGCKRQEYRKPRTGEVASPTYLPLKGALLERIRELAEIGETLKDQDMRRRHSGLYKVAVREFGTWCKARQAAACEVSVRRRKVDKPRMRAAILRRLEQGASLGRTAVRESDRSLYDAVLQLGAGWYDGLALLGFDPEPWKPSRR